MLSHRYTLKSNELKQQYIHDVITLPAYLAALKASKEEELSSVVFDFHHRQMEEEVAAFESRQFDEAKQERNTLKKEADVLQLRLETERTKQQQAQRQQAEEKKVQPQSLAEKILQARTSFYEQETPTLIATYKQDAKRHRATHDRWQVTVIFCSALASATTGTTIFLGETSFAMWVKSVATLLSLIVAIASGSLAYFKYKERSNDTQKAADTIEDDHTALRLGTGKYKGMPLEDALSTFAEHTHRTISEHKKKQLLLDQPPDAKSGQITS